jgi:hypothetical protein
MILCRIPLRACCCPRLTPFLWALCMRIAATRLPDPTHSLTHCRKPSKSPSQRGEQWTVTTDDSAVSSDGCHSYFGRLKQQHGNLDVQAEFYQTSYQRAPCKMCISVRFEYHIYIYMNCMLCVSHSLPTFSWQRATPVTVGRFAGRNWKSNSRWYT